MALYIDDLMSVDAWITFSFLGGVYFVFTFLCERMKSKALLVALTCIWILGGVGLCYVSLPVYKDCFILGMVFTALISASEMRRRANNLKYGIHVIAAVLLNLVFGVYVSISYDLFSPSEDQATLSPEEQLAKERTLLEEEKRKREAEAARALAEARERVKQEAERQRREAQLAKERRAREIKEAQVRDEIARLRAERNKLREEAIPRDVAAQIAEVNKQLEELKTTAPQPSELKVTNARNGEMSNASPAPRPSPGTSVDDQTRLVLSGLWLGACFFLQRVFEKLFKDKGYALLTVCAAGFLLAFFTANYFLLGGSVTGGLMGSVGERS